MSTTTPRQDRFNAWVAARPWATAVLSLVFVLLGVALFVNDDEGQRFDLGAPWIDYLLAPVTVLLGLAGLIAAGVRATRRG
jgi:hypothetical protein